MDGRGEYHQSMRRSIARVESRTLLGPDRQVDEKAIVIAPDAPARTDPFLVLAEDWFSSPGFDWHPHRGLETVTTVLGGVLEHGDNVGNAGALEAGDVQWMTAGRGIVHRELAYRDERAHTLQLWLNLPASAKLVEARYQDVLAASRPHVELDGVVIDLVSGSILGVESPTANHWPVQGAMVHLEPLAVCAYPLPADHRAFAYVVGGAVQVERRHVGTGQVAWSDPVAQSGTSVLTLAAADGELTSSVMIYSGRPIGEPVAFGGPFVMNDRQGVARAFEDFHAGRFGPVPKLARR